MDTSPPGNVRHLSLTLPWRDLEGDMPAVGMQHDMNSECLMKMHSEHGLLKAGRRQRKAAVGIFAALAATDSSTFGQIGAALLGNLEHHHGAGKQNVCPEGTWRIRLMNAIVGQLMAPIG